MKTQYLAPSAWLIVLMMMSTCCGNTAMSQALNRQEFLDRYYPFIEPGQEPPGRFAPDEKLRGMQTWQGQSGWRTRHGEAIVIWSLGKPSKVEQALYPDGSRGAASDTLDHGFRRRTTGERLWIYGRIDIRPDDVIFIDGDQPRYDPPPQGGVPNLEADLARDPAFLAAIKDDRFTLAVVNVFDNRDFYKGQDPRVWECGSRKVARLVAALRGLGESYHDYFPHAAFTGTYPDDRPEIEQRLQSRIDDISKSLSNDPPVAVPMEDLVKWLGPGEHSAEEVRRAMQLMRLERAKQQPAEIERYRDQQRVALERAQSDLAAFRDDHTNEDVLEALRVHLGRLGWRTETAQDRARIHQDWVGRAVEVLQQVKELEQRPAAPPPAWSDPLRRHAPVFGPAFGRGQLEAMSADVRAVETGELDRRLREIALTGRITEQDYHALAARSSRVAVIANPRGAAAATNVVPSQGEARNIGADRPGDPIEPR